jgi:hypothetical protein
MGSGVKGIVEAEKGREKERVEKQRLAMTMWRKGEQGGKRQEYKHHFNYLVLLFPPFIILCYTLYMLWKFYL